MYKIMTKLHTQRDGIYRFLMTENEDGRLVEYTTESREEVEAMTLALLKKVGYADLKIVQDEPYYIEINNVLDKEVTSGDIDEAIELMKEMGYEDVDLGDDVTYDVSLVWGNKPLPEQPKYIVRVEGPVELNYQPIVFEISGTCKQLEVPLSFAKGVKVFHLIVNGESFDKGIPDWIHYKHTSDVVGSLILSNVNQDYNIYIEVDAWIGDIDTTRLTPEQIEAINNMNIMLGEDLVLTYDNKVLPIDFELQGENLIVTSDIEGIGFKINANKELEVTYSDGNSN